MKKEENKGKNINENIKKAIDRIRPALQADGGDVEFVEFDKEHGLVKVQLQGMCTHCPMAEMTLKQGIEAEIKKDVPEVKEVVSV